MIKTKNKTLNLIQLHDIALIKVYQNRCYLNLTLSSCVQVNSIQLFFWVQDQTKSVHKWILCTNAMLTYFNPNAGLILPNHKWPSEHKEVVV